MKKKFTWKKAIYIVLGLVFAVALFSGIGYLVKSNSKESEAFLTRKPTVQNMDDKVMATGKLFLKRKLKLNRILQGLSIKFWWMKEIR
ncbi:hypothetical protein ACFOEQ_11685 [Chryseobacterium arachidis]|uniref:hypothetical protein n=1 Tax=Chryseobacterium arachidis TaxID=1416778 RepID=UPI0036243593